MLCSSRLRNIASEHNSSKQPDDTVLLQATSFWIHGEEVCRYWAYGSATPARWMTVHSARESHGMMFPDIFPVQA